MVAIVSLLWVKIMLYSTVFFLIGTQALGNLVDVLIQENIYDMAFIIIVKSWKGSGLKRYSNTNFRIPFYV